MAFLIDASVNTSADFIPRASSVINALALRRAMSSQMGCPEGANALCGRDMPSASPTTWELAAVPKN